MIQALFFMLFDSVQLFFSTYNDKPLIKTQYKTEKMGVRKDQQEDERAIL